jgi:hypothetical protein
MILKINNKVYICFIANWKNHVIMWNNWNILKSYMGFSSYPLWTLWWRLKQNTIKYELKHDRMHLHTLFQGQLETLVEASTSTAINFFRMNFSKVDCQTVPPCKRFATHCATVWLFACVHSHMLIKFASLCKWFVTQCAIVWFFACVSSHMQIKKEPLCKRFVTQCAAVWLFTWVNSHMSTKITFPTEGFAALLAA